MLVFVIVAASADAWAGPDPERFVDSRGREYFVWAPETINPDITYRLVVLVHGNKGTGRRMGREARHFLARGDVICVAPSFPSPGFQGLELETGEQALEVVAEMKKRYRLYDRIFVHGHSAGAQFAHRFTLRYPQHVAGCSAHSAGSAAVGQRFDYYYRPGAENVPMVLSWGEKDTKKAWENAPHTRVEYGRLFVKEAEEHGLLAVVVIEAGRGHGIGRDGARLRDECFDLVMQHLPTWDRLEASIAAELDAGRRPVSLIRRALAQPAPGTRIGTLAYERFHARVGRLKERCDKAVDAFVKSLPPALRAIHDRIAEGRADDVLHDLQQLVADETATDGPAHQIMRDVTAAATAGLEVIRATLDRGDVYAAHVAFDEWEDQYSRLQSLEDAADEIDDRLSDREVRRLIRLGEELADLLAEDYRTDDQRQRALQRFVDQHSRRYADSRYVKRAVAELEAMTGDDGDEASDD